jgi:hypothetical protein
VRGATKKPFAPQSSSIPFLYGWYLITHGWYLLTFAESSAARGLKPKKETQLLRAKVGASALTLSALASEISRLALGLSKKTNTSGPHDTYVQRVGSNFF